MSATSELIAFVQQLDGTRLSDPVIQQAKRCVLDFLGVAVAGSRTQMAQVSARFALGQFGGGEATVVGFPWCLSPIGAAWLNGISATALDLDDGHRLAMGHPGASVIPTALVVAEMVGASGQDLLTAIVAGYEVAVRASVSRTPAFKERLYNTGIWGAFGAVAAAAKLLRFDDVEFQNALGIAVAHGPFPPSGADSKMTKMTKEAIGWAGVVGCAAALLARQGFEAMVDSLDHSHRYDTDQLVQGLDQEYAILKTYFKPHASCRWSHPAIDGVLQLVNQYRIEPQEVRAVLVEGFYETTQLSDPAPSKTIDAQFSIPFCIALALVYRSVSVAEMTATNLDNRQVLSLAQRVNITVVPEFDRQFPEKTVTRVTLDTTRGTLTATVECPKGDPLNPMTDAELFEKLKLLAFDILGQDRVFAVKDAVDHLDHLENVRRLTRLLAL